MILAVFAGLSLFTKAAVLTVDNRDNAVAMFSDLGAAIDAAENGDTIQIAGSVRTYGSHNVYKPLHFRGPGYYLSENNVEGLNQNDAAVILTFLNSSEFGSASGSTARFLTGTFRGASEDGLVSFSVSFCRGTVGGGLGGDLCPRVTVHRCDVSQFTDMASGSSITDSIVSNLALEDNCIADRCIIRGTGRTEPLATISDSIFIVSSSSSFNSNHEGSISHCMAIGGNFLPAGNGNINDQFANVVFVQGDSPDGAFQLRAGSPAIGVGRNGGDLGAFGGVNPYRLSGLPSIPRITNITIDAVATDANGLTFNVDAVAVGTTSEE